MLWLIFPPLPARALRVGLIQALGRMSELTEDWPEDADGGVFRRLLEHRFDFSKPHSIDYSVDFERWPPALGSLAWLESHYGTVSLHPPTEDFGGYAEFQVHGLVTYEGVTSIPRQVSAALAPWGGVCESWGVLQDAP